MKYYLGIDIGGTHIKGGIVNLLTNDIHQNILSHEELNATDSTSSIIKMCIRDRMLPVISQMIPDICSVSA